MMGRGMIPSSPVPVLVRLVFLCGSGLPGPGRVLRRRLGLLDEQFLLGSLDGLQGGRAPTWRPPPVMCSGVLDRGAAVSISFKY